MDSIQILGVVLLPHTWPLFLGIPALLITGAVAGCLYEFLTNRGDV